MNTSNEKNTLLKIHKPSLILMITGIAFDLTIPFIAIPCNVISLIMSIRRLNTHKKSEYFIVANSVAVIIELVWTILIKKDLTSWL